MRKLLVFCMMGLCLFSYQAQAVPDWIIPSPVTIALQVGKWIFTEDSQLDVYYIRVQAEGASETEARQEAFRLAVDQAVGSLLVSETEISDGNIRRHDVINYSSGYIHNFEYVNIYRQTESVIIQIDVWVAGSKIANRLGIDSVVTGNLQGGRIAESFSSLQKENATGDQLLKNVLDDFPEKALDIKIDNIEYIYNQRVPVLNLKFLVWWKEKYVTSLRETVGNLGKAHSWWQEHSLGTTFVKEKCFMCGNKHYAIDQARSTLVFEGIWAKKPNVLITILDSHGQPVYKQCWYWNNMQGNDWPKNLFDSSTINTTIYPDRVFENSISLNLENFSVKRMDKVELSIVRANRCP